MHYPFLANLLSGHILFGWKDRNICYDSADCVAMCCLSWLLLLSLVARHMIKLNQNKESISPFKSEFTIVIFIHYKPRIAVVILDL